MSDSIPTSPSTPTLFNRESIKQSLIKNSVDPNQAEKITAQLEKDNKGKSKYTEEDVFKAASKIYSFDINESTRSDKTGGGNIKLRDAIDALNGDVNVDYKYEGEDKGKGTSKAVWQAISGNPDGDSRNIVSRSIDRLQKEKLPATSENIISDLEKHGVFKDGQNPTLKSILDKIKDNNTPSVTIKDAVKNDNDWQKLINPKKS